MIPWFRERAFPTRSAVAMSLCAVSLCALISACGGAAAPSASATADRAKQPPGGRRALLKDLQQSSRVQADRIAELEVRLALLEGELHEMRAIACPTEGRRSETIRIGGGSKSEEAFSVEETSEKGGGSRPVLRLYGAKPANAQPARSAAPLSVPPVPQGVPPRLPVVPLPKSDRGAIPLSRVNSSNPGNAPTLGDDSALSEYRAALALVRSRKYDRALKALAAFLVRYPSSAYSDNAMYWRGEAYYAKRQYVEAIAQFEGVAARFPSGDKVADSLLKIGMCHRRLGNGEEARSLFRRVRREFPHSDAARVASQEVDHD